MAKANIYRELYSLIFLAIFQIMVLGFASGNYWDYGKSCQIWYRLDIYYNIIVTVKHENDFRFFVLLNSARVNRVSTSRPISISVRSDENNNATYTSPIRRRLERNTRHAALRAPTSFEMSYMGVLAFPYVYVLRTMIGFAPNYRSISVVRYIFCS